MQHAIEGSLVLRVLGLVHSRRDLLLPQEMLSDVHQMDGRAHHVLGGAPACQGAGESRHVRSMRV